MFINVNFGGLNVLYYKDFQDRCGDFFLVGLGYIEVLIFVIE